MTQRQLGFVALALTLAYAVAFFTLRDPVCRIGSVSRASIGCAPPPAPIYERRHPAGRVVMLSATRAAI